MKILIEIPHTGMFPYQFVNSYPLMLATTMKSGIGIEYELRGHSLVYEAREQAAKHFLESDCDYLLFLDSDMVPPADMLIKLINHDKPIVSALAFRRVPNYEPCIFKDDKFYLDYPKGLIEVAGVGMACTLIKREVLENMPQPWFFPTNNGEDLSFCKRATDAGYKIYCDTELICGHVGSFEVTEEHFRRLTMFNDEAYIKELTDYINKLNIDSVLEVGCRTGELLEGLTAKEKVGIDPEPERGTAIITTLEEYKPGRKFDIVFSSGVMEHFERDYVVELLKKQAELSNKYVLTLVPNASCNAYNAVKHCFDPEDSYSYAELIEQYQKAEIKVVDSGTMAFEWCVNRFRMIPNQGYLSYVLGEV